MKMSALQVKSSTFSSIASLIINITQMKYKKSLILIFVVLVLLGGTAAVLFRHEAVDPAKPVVFNADTAMLAIFGTYNEKQHGVLLPEANTSKWNMKGAETLATALLTATYEEGGKKKAVLALQRQDILEGEVVESHATAPVISVYIFAHDGKQWVFEKGKKEVTSAGSHGSAPGSKLIRLGQDKYGLLFEGGDVHQGYTNDYAFLISLSDVKPGKVLDLDTGASNSGTCSDDPADQGEGSILKACWERTGKISFLQNGKDDYFVLKLTSLSNEDADDKRKMKKTEQYYVRTAGGYKLSKDSLKNAKLVADELVYHAGDAHGEPAGVATIPRNDVK